MAKNPWYEVPDGIKRAEEIGRQFAAENERRQAEMDRFAQSTAEMHRRKEQLRKEGVEREEALIELTAQNAERIGELITVVAAQAELAAEQRDLAADQRDLAAEQHEENRRLSLLTNVVSLAVILQVLLMVFDPNQVWAKIAVVASAVIIAVVLAWAGRLWSARKSKRKD